MSDNFGTNFNTYAPPQGLQPSAVSGIEGGLEWIARMQAQKQALEQMGIQTQQGQANLSRYQQMTPGMVQVQDLAGAQAQAQNNPQQLEQYGRGQFGAAQSLQAKGSEDIRTLDSRVGKANSSNVTAELESTARSLELAQAAGGLNGQSAWSSVRERMSPTMQQHFPPEYTPAIPDMIRQLSRALENTPQHRAEMEKQEAGFGQNLQLQGMLEDKRQFGATERANIAADATRYGADRGADRAAAAETPQKAITRLRRELSQNPEQSDKIEEYQSHLEDQWNTMIQRDPGLMLLRVRATTSDNEETKKKAAAEYNRLRKEFFAEKGIFIGPQPQSGAVRAHPQFGNIRWVPGFNRNPANPEHWQKVNPNPREAR